MTTKDEQLKLELQRIRSIVGQVTGLDDEDEDNLRDAYKSIDRVIYSLAEQPAQQEPPTVAELLCVCGAEWEWRNRDWELVATPPANTNAGKPWVGLTDEQIMEMYNEPRSDAEMIAFARAIEAKLKEKNT